MSLHIKDGEVVGNGGALSGVLLNDASPGSEKNRQAKEANERVKEAKIVLQKTLKEMDRLGLTQIGAGNIRGKIYQALEEAKKMKFTARDF